MKIIRTASFNKLSKKKEWDPNPWAVCHTTVDKDDDPDKYERCVQEVKKKQETKPAKMPKNNRGKWDAEGNFSNLLNYLRENIHQHGSIYRATDLINRVTGEDLNPDYFIKYLKEKFYPIYGI